LAASVEASMGGWGSRRLFNDRGLVFGSD